MSVICPNCGKEYEEDVRICEECGKEIGAVEEAPVPEAEPAVTEEPAEAAAETAEAPEAAEENTQLIEADAESDPADDAGEPAAEGAEEDADAFSLEKVAPDPAIGVPLQESPAEEKKNKHLGLGIAVCACIVLLIAAIITIIILLIPKGSQAKEEVLKYTDAYIASDYEYYFNHDYYTVFNSENVDDSIKQAEDYEKENEGSITKDFDVTILNVTPLSPETTAKIVHQLEDNAYKQTDKIEDIQMVNVETESKAQDMISIDTIYVVKVDGKYYIASGF